MMQIFKISLQISTIIWILNLYVVFAILTEVSKNY